MQHALDRDKLRALISERGTSARAVSLKIGDNQTLVRDILRGQSKNPRLDTLQKIAEELGVHLESLLMGRTIVDNQASPSQIEPRYLQVRFKTKAGLWFEPESEEPPEDVVLPVASLPQYAAYPQWLEKIEGDSANKRFPDGTYIHVVDAIELGYAPKHDDWVVVVRERDQGAVRERSVKQVEIAEDGTITLWPRSTDPRWQRPIDFSEGTRPGEDVTVQIVCKVLGGYFLTP